MKSRNQHCPVAESKGSSPSAAHSSKRLVSGGFSLIELMVAVAVIGILSAVAIPAYSNYVKSGNAQEAPSNLMTMKTQAEQYFSDNPALGFKDFPCTAPSAAKFFDYACTYTPTTVPQNTITITATGKSSSNISGWTYTIDQTGVRTSSGIGTSSSTSCWITKYNGSC
jgi:type IV pilus assembly protein PilE